jgi:hypothetical protein
VTFAGVSSLGSDSFAVRFDARADLNSAVIMNKRNVPIAAQRFIETP